MDIRIKNNDSPAEIMNIVKSDADKSDCSSTLISHNININGHRTSVRLEKEMWMGLKDISRREKCHVHDLCSKVSVKKRKDTSLTAAIRVFVMAYYQSAATDEGHIRAGHGLGANAAVSVMAELNEMPYYGLRNFKKY